MVIDKLEGIEKRQNKFEATLSEKLTENSSNLSSKFTEVHNSYANKIKQINSQDPVQDFRKIIEETRNEELVQAKEREARQSNIIIHGFTESASGDKAADADQVKESFGIIGLDCTPKVISQLCEKKDDRRRPIKLIMSTTEEKAMVMANLIKLKDCEKFKKVSVTDDYTAKEREEVRNMVKEAKRITELEGDDKFVFKVRGTPKNGLVIRRFAAPQQ